MGEQDNSQFINWLRGRDEINRVSTKPDTDTIHPVNPVSFLTFSLEGELKRVLFAFVRTIDRR